jgi:hypothetical protein
MRKRFWENEQVPNGMTETELAVFWGIVDFNYRTDTDWEVLTQSEGKLASMDMYN